MLNTSTLVYKTKDELAHLLRVCAEEIEEEDQDLVYGALQDAEQIIYVLKNCDYEGKKA